MRSRKEAAARKRQQLNPDGPCCLERPSCRGRCGVKKAGKPLSVCFLFYFLNEIETIFSQRTQNFLLNLWPEQRTHMETRLVTYSKRRDRGFIPDFKLHPRFLHLLPFLEEARERLEVITRGERKRGNVFLEGTDVLSSEASRTFLFFMIFWGILGLYLIQQLRHERGEREGE